MFSLPLCYPGHELLAAGRHSKQNFVSTELARASILHNPVKLWSFMGSSDLQGKKGGNDEDGRQWFWGQAEI